MHDERRGGNRSLFTPTAFGVSTVKSAWREWGQKVTRLSDQGS